MSEQPPVEPPVAPTPGAPAELPADVTEPAHEVHLPPGVTRGPETVRAFRHVLANTLVANVTTSYLWFALTFWAYLETRSVLATSIIGGSYMLLVAVFGTVFGTIVDRYRKRDVMVASSVVTLGSYLLAGVIYLLFDESQLVDWGGPAFWLFATVILVGGVVESLRNIALSTTVTLLVPADERANANGLVGTVQGVSFMVTSVFSGLSVGLVGMGWTVAIAVALTAAALAHLVTVPVPERTPAAPEDGTTGPIADVSGAWRAIRAVPGLLPLLLFAVFNNLVGGVYMALMDPYGLTLFSVEVWGVVLGLTSIGFIVGGAVVARVGLGANPLRTLLLVNVGVAVIGGLFTIRESPWLFLVGCFVFMSLMPAAEASEQTILQRVVPYSTQGRVFGFAQSMEVAASPVSAFLIGPVAQFWVIPYMRSAEGRQTWGWLLGEGEARGMALVFLVAGLVSLGAVLLAFASRPYRRLSRAYAEAPASEGG